MAQIAYYMPQVRTLFFLLAVCVHAAGSQEPLDDVTSLLQLAPKLAGGLEAPAAGGRRDLVMAYLPYNFGHTVAMKAARSGVQWGDCGERFDLGRGCLGHQRSAVTGCELMYTPGKLWPKDLAQAYFGNRTIFGILRDPYERMVAQFRGSGRSEHPDLYAACDVNTAVKIMMREQLSEIQAGRPYGSNCQKLPQAEFFDQPYGATIVVDNRRFPLSANELLVAHGYDEMQISTGEVSHISGCDHIWAGDLDSEAKSLVRQVYARDFELQCKHFGHCDKEENTCITTVPGMCPPQLFTWSEKDSMFVRN